MTTFTINNIDYIQNENGYCYMVENGKKSRISKTIFDEALEQYIAQQVEDIEVQGAKAEQKKPAKKSKKSKKNAAYEIEIDGEKITLTEKQKIFFETLPNDNFFDHGVESALWTDIYCDTLADIMDAMVVGAVISTLREKDLIYVEQGRVNGKKCKYFGFTELGKAILKEMGLV